MTYGSLLEEAAAALASAHLHLRDPPPATITDHAAAAISRTHLYRAIERQVRQLVRGTTNGLLREVTHATFVTAPDIPPTPAFDHPVASALHRAADALRLGSDILLAQFETATGHPRSPQGLAMLVDTFRHNALDHLARLAIAAAHVDHPLADWLTQGTTTGSRQPIVVTAAADARTTSRTLRHAVRAVDTPLNEMLHALQPPPLVDEANRWTTIRSPTDCATALDAVRTWLVQHRRHVTAADLRTLTRSGMALSYEVDYLVTLHDDPRQRRPIDPLASAWRGAGRAADHLHTLGHATPGVGPNVMSAAEKWLRAHLRTHGTWRNPQDLLRSPQAPAWQSAAVALAARLPDLVTLVHDSALTAVRSGTLVEPDPLHRPRQDLTFRPRMVKAGPATYWGATLLRHTGQLRQESMLLVRDAKTTPLPGLYEALADGRAPSRSRKHPARSPAQSHPNPSVPRRTPAPSVGHAAGHRQPAQPDEVRSHEDGPIL
ncbi:hypothetical protein [Micromonospora sp. SH-82]|uniref:hypothetical protein n=1 Tax=Micromonospora sp. SH-82 TaxID=3132938 RepID=UPI003EBEE598